METFDDTPGLKRELEQNSFKWVFTWAASILGAIIAAYLLGSLLNPLLTDINNQFLPITVAWIMLGGILGTAQWLVLRTRLPVNAYWVLATAAACTFFIAAHNGLEILEEQYRSRMIHFWDSIPTPLVRRIVDVIYVRVTLSDLREIISISILLGLALGLAQWIILRRHLQHAGWWIWINLAGSALAYWLAFRLQADSFTTFFYFFLYGLFTGAGLLLLIKRNRQPPPSE